MTYCTLERGVPQIAISHRNMINALSHNTVNTEEHELAMNIRDNVLILHNTLLYTLFFVPQQSSRHFEIEALCTASKTS